MKKVVIILSLISILSLIQFAFATVSVSNTSIANQYAPNGTITGWINLSLTNEPTNTYITTNFGQNISLISLIKLQKNFNSSCNPIDCSSSYAASDSGGLTSQFFLSNGSSKTFGFVVPSSAGKISNPGAFNLNISSDAPLSNMPQLIVDLLNDGNPEWNSFQAAGTFGQSSSFGCYSSNYPVSNAVISFNGQNYCERITIPTAPAVKIGAYVTKTGVLGSTLSMSIQDVNGNYSSGSCTVTSPTTGPISCIATINGNYVVNNTGDFYVCISDKSNLGASGGNYQINYSANTAPCGFSSSNGRFPGNYSYDFQIFAQPDQFAPVGNLSLNGVAINSILTNYLQTKYNYDCSKSGCVIPIVFTAGKDQNINLSNFSLLYTTNGGNGITTSTNLIYNVTTTPGVINTNGYQLLLLDPANLSVNGTFGSANLILTLQNGTSYQLLSQNINIVKIPQIISISPQTTIAAMPTNFTVTINTFGSNSSITSYQWNFGDGSPLQTTTTNTIQHTYNNILLGGYGLQVTVTNSVGLSSSRNLSITVNSPRDAVNNLLQQDLNSLQNLKTEIGNITGFSKTALTNSLNISGIQTTLGNLQVANNTAATDQKYIDIMKQLIPINLPQSIQETSSATSVPFIPSKDSINLDVLKKVGGSDYNASRESDYLDAITAWEISNANVMIDYHEFSANYGGSTSPILDVVTLNIGASSSRSNAYLILPPMANISFDSNITSSGSYFYTTLDNNAKQISFSTTDSISPTELSFFIAPSLSQINLPGQPTSPSGNNKMIILIIIVASIILVGGIAYVLIGRWYQKRYESYLFKDKNDLFNIVNYVHSAKTKGVANPEIEKNLKKSNWNSEQIGYIMKKYAGKAVGIPGFLNNKNKNK